MKINAPFIFLLLLSLIVSCDSPYDGIGIGKGDPAMGEAEKLQVVSIDMDVSRKAKLSEYFSEINYTLLDYSDDEPIVNAYNMDFAQDKIYVESRETAKVFVFDKNGKVLNILGKNGDGPGEFRLIDDISVSGDTVRVRVGHANKYVLLNHQGDLLGEEKLDYRGVLYEDLKFSLYHIQDGVSEERWTYLRKDKVKNNEVGYLPIRKGFERFYAFGELNGFIIDPINGEIFFAEHYDYLVQNFDKEGFLKKTIRFDFGKNNWDLKSRLELARSGQERQDYLSENQVVQSIGDFFPFQDVFFMSFRMKMKNYWVFMDKSFENLNVINDWENDLDLMKLDYWTWTKTEDEIIYQKSSRGFFNDYKAAFNGKSVVMRPGDVHHFFEENREKLQEEKIVLISLKLK